MTCSGWQDARAARAASISPRLAAPSAVWKPACAMEGGDESLQSAKVVQSLPLPRGESRGIDRCDELQPLAATGKDLRDTGQLPVDESVVGLAAELGRIANPALEVLAHLLAGRGAEGPCGHVVAGGAKLLILRILPDLLDVAGEKQIERARYPVDDSKAARLGLLQQRVEARERCIGPADIVTVVVLRPDHGEHLAMPAGLSQLLPARAAGQLRLAVEDPIVQADEFHARRQEQVGARQEVEIPGTGRQLHAIVPQLLQGPVEGCRDLADGQHVMAAPELRRAAPRRGPPDIPPANAAAFLRPACRSRAFRRRGTRRPGR